jgi:diguanylate cyclase (GGDEF)-like protein/PAS domain S-box-containing protein
VEVFESYSDRMEQKLDEKLADLSAARILRDSYHALLDNLPVYVLTLDPEGRPDFTNAPARTFAGVDDPAALLDHVHPQDRVKVKDFIESLLADPHPMQTSIMLRGRDGAYRVFEVTGRPYQSPSGERLGYILAAEDITLREQEKELLLHAAEYDPLTDLPTRYVFDQRFDEILMNVGRGARCALLFIDSDDLRGINDRYGFDVGDATVANLAHAIVGAVRPDDLVARLCATEFVVLAEDLGWDEANELSDAVKAAVAQAALVPAAPGMRIGVNIRINVIPEVDLSVHGPRSGAPAESAAGSESRLREALQGVPDMLYRPVYSLDSGALVRCSVRYAYSVDDRMISGEELALGAARHGIARRMGMQIIELALAQVRDTGVACSVPLSLANVLDPMIFERAELAAESTAVGASKLLFEVPDSDAEGIRLPVSWLSAARGSAIGLVHVCNDLSTLVDDHIQIGASDEIALPVTEVADAHGTIRPSAAAAIARWREIGVPITVTHIADRTVLDMLRAAGVTRVSGDALSPAAPSPRQLPPTLPGEE